ncbi:MAG TPA: hypothetical protein VJ570_11760 [Holophagaceae bacterium]|nr:hypothetical protein [Holophagaceae bacterium]
MKAALLIVPALGISILGAQAPAPARIQLPSGLTASLWEDHEAPLIRLEGLLPIRAEEVPAHLPGLPALLLATLEAGPKGNRSASEFQALLDRSGIRMELTLDPRGLRLSMACRSRDQELAFGLLGDLLGRSPLDPDALEPQRLRIHHRPAPSEATDQFLARVSGSILLQPPEATLARASLADLESLLHRICRPDRLRLHIQGDLNPAQATQRLLLDLGAWSPAPASAPPPGETPSADTKVEQAGPGELLVAFPAPLPEEPATPLLEILLARRLEGHGLPGDPWHLHFQGETPQALLASLQARLADLTFTDAELAAAQKLWKGRQALLPLDPGAALQARLRGLPAPADVAKLTRTEVEIALKALLSRGRKLWRGDAAWLKTVS